MTRPGPTSSRQSIEQFIWIFRLNDNRQWSYRRTRWRRWLNLRWGHPHCLFNQCQSLLNRLLCILHGWPPLGQTGPGWTHPARTKSQSVVIWPGKMVMDHCGSAGCQGNIWCHHILLKNSLGLTQADLLPASQCTKEPDATQQAQFQLYCQAPFGRTVSGRCSGHRRAAVRPIAQGQLLVIWQCSQCCPRRSDSPEGIWRQWRWPVNAMLHPELHTLDKPRNSQGFACVQIHRQPMELLGGDIHDFAILLQSSLQDRPKVKVLGSMARNWPQEALPCPRSFPLRAPERQRPLLHWPQSAPLQVRESHDTIDHSMGTKQCRPASMICQRLRQTAHFCYQSWRQHRSLASSFPKLRNLPWPWRSHHQRKVQGKT